MSIRQQIDEIFDRYTNQWDVVVALYRLAHPDYDNIKKLVGWPRVGEELGDYIMQKFREFDRKYHPDVISGGAWFNYGFSYDKEIEGDVIIPAEVERYVDTEDRQYQTEA